MEYKISIISDIFEVHSIGYFVCVNSAEFDRFSAFVFTDTD